MNNVTDAQILGTECCGQPTKKKVPHHIKLVNCMKIGFKYPPHRFKSKSYDAKSIRHMIKTLIDQGRVIETEPENGKIYWVRVK